MPIDPGIYNRRSPIQPVDVESILGPEPTQQRQGSPALEASRILTFQKQQREQQLAAQYGDDPETFIRELSRVDPEKSESYRKTWLDGLKASAERHKADVENQRAHIALGVNLVQGAGPNTWPAVRTAIVAMSPDLAQLLPDQYDEQAIGRLIEIGRTSDQYLDAQAKAADLLGAGKTQQAFWQGIAGTSNQAQLDAAKELAGKAQLTPYLKMLGDRPWSPELQQEAAAKAMDPKDQYAVAHPEAASATSGKGSDYSQFLASFAAEKGKPVGKLTVAEHVAARKAYGQADDAARRPLAPIVIMTPQGPMVTTGNDRQTVVPITGPGGTVGNKLTGTMAEKVAGMEASDAILSELETLMKPEWLGPIGGRYTESVVLKAPGFDVGSDLAKFAAQSATIKNTVIKAITGAQMSEKEGARILEQVPKFTDKPSVWTANLNATRENLRMLHDRILANTGAQRAPDTSGGTQQQKAGPKNGDKRKFPGNKIGQWNGKEWIQVGQ